MSSATTFRDVPARMSKTSKRTGMPAALVAQSLWKSYRMGAGDIHALRGLNLRVDRGELVAIMGPSGYGKSTLLHTLGGLLSPTSGSVVIEGEDLATMSDAERTELRRKRIGFVFQRFNLFSTLTVEGNLQLAERISLGRRDPSMGAARRLDLLSILGLSKSFATNRSSFLVASNNASRSRGPSYTSLRFSSRTSRRGISTRRARRTCSRCSNAFTRSSGRRSFSSPMTSMLPNKPNASCS